MIPPISFLVRLNHFFLSDESCNPFSYSQFHHLWAEQHQCSTALWRAQLLKNIAVCHLGNSSYWLNLLPAQYIALFMDQHIKFKVSNIIFRAIHSWAQVCLRQQKKKGCFWHLQPSETTGFVWLFYKKKYYAGINRRQIFFWSLYKYLGWIFIANQDKWTKAHWKEKILPTKIEFQDYFCFDIEEKKNNFIYFCKSCISVAHNERKHTIVNRILYCLFSFQVKMVYIPYNWINNGTRV